jgi:hypothetical protein
MRGDRADSEGGCWGGPNTPISALRGLFSYTSNRNTVARATTRQLAENKVKEHFLIAIKITVPKSHHVEFATDNFF